MSAIKSDHVFIDNRNQRWYVGPNYQESKVDQPGYLELKSETGLLYSFSEVVELYGFSGPDGRYLVVREKVNGK